MAAPVTSNPSSGGSAFLPAIETAMRLSRSTRPLDSEMPRIMEAEQVIGAMDDANHAVLLNRMAHEPANGFLRLWNGLVLMARGKAPEACQEFLAAGEMGCNNWRIGWYLAQAAKDAGDLECVDAACAAVLKANPEFWFARELPKHARGFYSQCGQDEWIERFFQTHKPRVKRFVEVGAFDGVHYSNVRRLHEKYGWSGLSVEPIGKNFRKLAASYQGSSVICVNAAVSTREGDLKMDVSTYPHLPDWGSDVASLGGGEKEKWTREYGAVWTTETVRARTLTSLVAEAGIEDFDVLSVDTEGHDLEVLKSLDFNRFRPQVIVVEFGDHREELLALMKAQGYQLELDNGQDLIMSCVRPAPVVPRKAASPIPEKQMSPDEWHAMVNPHLLKHHYVPAEASIPMRGIPAIDLLVPARFDIAAKCLFARMHRMQAQTRWHREIYHEHIRAFSGGECREGDGLKHNIGDYFAGFERLLKDVGENGFNCETSLVPVGADNVIIDGSHRVAAGIEFDQEIGILGFDQKANVYDAAWFRDRGLSETACDAVAMEYCRRKADVYVLMLFPVAGLGRENEVRSMLNKIGQVVYEKEVRFFNNGPWLFVRQVYDGEPWIGAWPDDFANTRRDAGIRFGGEAPLRVMMFECPSLERVKATKAAIRAMYGIGNYSCHVNDTHAQAVYLSEILFNRQSIAFLNAAQPRYFERFEKQLQTYREWLKKHALPGAQFCIDGSAVMAVHGLRDSADLDVIHFADADFSDVEPLVNSHNPDAHHHVFHRDDILFNPDLHFHFLGCKFATLDVIRRLKVKRNEEKDRRDVAMMDELIGAASGVFHALRRRSETVRIVGLVGVRNEAPRMAFCLRSLARFCDAIVVLDDCSEDDTVKVVESLAGECKVERILRKDHWHRDEPGDRNAQLNAGREIGGTHFIVMDADEAFTSNLAKDGTLRRMIADLEPGDQLCLPLLNLWRGFKQFRSGGPGWCHDVRPFAFADDGVTSYSSEFIHTPRVPVDLQGHKWNMDSYAMGVMHFQFVNWPALMLKQAWYRCMERVRRPERSDEDINTQYWQTEDESGMELKPVPQEWLQGYEFFDPAAFEIIDAFRQKQMIDWLREKGVAQFAGLDIWRIDWSFAETVAPELYAAILKAKAAARPAIRSSSPAAKAVGVMPVVEYGEGMHGSEGDFRWIDLLGLMSVNRVDLDSPARLSFDLRCGKLQWYGVPVLTVTIQVEDQIAATLDFVGDFQTQSFDLPLPMGRNPVRVSIASSHHFVGGGGDTRRLTVQLRNVSVQVERASEQQTQPTHPSAGRKTAAGGASVSFGDGIHKDEGGFRWLDSVAVIKADVPSRLAGALLSFDLRVGKMEWYPSRPVRSVVAANGMAVREIVFAGDFQTETIQIELPSGDGPALVQIESSPYFGGDANDPRHLTVQLRDCAIGPISTPSVSLDVNNVTSLPSVSRSSPVKQQPVPTPTPSPACDPALEAEAEHEYRTIEVCQGFDIERARKTLDIFSQWPETVEYHRNHLNRYLATMERVRHLPRSTRVLEVGASPFGMTVLMREFLFDFVQPTGFAENDSKRAQQVYSEKLVIGKPQEGRGFEFDLQCFNIEKHQWPFADGSFDLVISCEVFEHLALDPMFAMAEINRVTRPGGTLLISVPNVLCVSNVYKMLDGRSPNSFPVYRPRGECLRHNRELTPTELATMFKAAGFDLQKVETSTFNPPAHVPPAMLAKIHALTGGFEWRHEVLTVVGRKTGPVVNRYPLEAELYYEWDVKANRV